MSTVMTAEKRAEAAAKTRATKDAQKAKREQSRIAVDGYSIYRLDEHNWCIERKGNVSYFSTIAGCMESLFEKLVGRRVGSTLESILADIDAARTDIRGIQARMEQ
jgi:hypothetical protein